MPVVNHSEPQGDVETVVVEYVKDSCVALPWAVRALSAVLGVSRSEAEKLVMVAEAENYVFLPPCDMSAEKVATVLASLGLKVRVGWLAS